MNEISAARLSRKSQQLAIDEFQLIDLNMDLLKNTEENENVDSSKELTLKNASKTLRKNGVGLTKSQSNIKLPESIQERRKSFTKGTSRPANSSTADLIRQMENKSAENIADTKISSSMLDTKPIRSQEQIIMNIESSQLEDFVKIEEKKPDPVELHEQEDIGKSISFASVNRRDICRDKSCLDTDIRLPPIHRTESQNAAWDIKCLGVPQGIDNKPLLSIARVNNRRREKHEYIIKEMDLRMNDLNEVIEQEIRQQADNVKLNIHMVKDSVEQIMSTIKEKTNVSLNKTLSTRMQEIIKQLNDNRLSKINSFCDFARSLERHRSERFKLILRNAYKEMHDNMYLMPYEIQKFFEKKIQHLNEITMNNYHCYTELSAKLKLQMEEEMRLWFQVLKGNETINRHIEESTESIREPTLEISEELVKGPTKADILKKLEKAEEDFRRLKKVATNLRYLKSHPTLEVFESYLDEMRNAAIALFHAGLIGRDGLCLDQKTIQDLSTMHCMDEEELKKIWADGIEEMLKDLDTNLMSFSNSTRIFDFYFDRLEEMRCLYKEQLFLLVTKNDKQILQMNNVMNLLIDTLRQDVNEENLNNTLQQIQTTIGSIDSLIQNHLKEETALVDKYLQIASSNVDILIEELNRFIRQFVPPPDADPRIMKKRASWMDIDELRTDDHLFSKDFLTCRFLMQGVNNWQFGVWHALITTMDTSKHIISMILLDWANAEKHIFTTRAELKTKINNVRIHNIKEDFYKVRLAELNIHEERFLQHELAVREKITEMSALKCEIEQACKDFLDEESNNRIDKIMEGYKNIEKERHAISMINKLKELSLSVSTEMKERHENFKNEYFGIMINIRNSHIQFMKSIRLFSEDGNFTSDEAKTLIKRFSALEKLMAKEFANVNQIVERIYRDFVDDLQDKLEMPLHNLNKALEEFTFKNDMERKVKKLHREIGDIVVDLTFDMRKLNGKIRSCRTAAYSKENLGSYDFLFSFSRCFKEILADINMMNERLFYDNSLSLDERLLKQKAEISQVSLTPTVASKTKKNIDSKTAVEENVSSAKKYEKRRSLRTTAPAIKVKNYVFALYPFPPQDDGRFLSTLHLKTYVSYCDVQDAAKYFEFRYDELMGKCSEVMKNLGGAMKLVEDNYTSIHNKLKPMLGHPAREKMLALVETYMDQAEDFNKRVLLDNLEPSQESIKHHCIKTEAIFLDMEKILSCIRGSSTLLALSRELQDKLCERIEALQQILSVDDCCGSRMCQTDFEIDLKRKLQEYKKTAPIPTECLISYSNVAQSTSSLESSDHLDIEESIKKNFNMYEKVVETIENHKTNCWKLHEKYKTMWAQDIQRILNLYKVKYDQAVSE
ncbi:uncharacterized protein LOC123689003 isoform X2 [Harmonia axyridis]|uniref:uncharacterized protein LOC123689003 isoform X2 n=1 Tax=Harmonia axyridis TaxID=115357 RepID=UPI001E27639E|nr:uncharacterized protein LOC123689003 isoform X2 [Harmonia axyridis]